MAIDDDRELVTVERFERRLAEECGKLRQDMTAGFGNLRVEMGNIRAEMADRNADLLKWLLAFFAAQTAALTGIFALFR